MDFSLSAPRFLAAIAALVVLALCAGSLSAPLEASAHRPGKAAAAKRKKQRSHKRGHHRVRKGSGKQQAWAPVAATPSASDPAVGQSQAPNGSQPSQQPTRPTKPSTSTPPVPTPPPPSATPPPSTPSMPTAPAVPPSTPSVPSNPSLPPSSTGGSGDLLFRAERIGDFSLAQSAPGAITEVPDPAGSGQSVFKMTVSDNDGYPVTPTENPRAEMLSPANIESGDEFWWSAKFFLPADFPSTTPNFVGLVQGPYGYPWRGTPPFHIEANNGVLKWQRNQTYNWDIPWQIPQIRNQWVSVLIHERFAADGWIEMWINGQQITFFGPGSYNPNREPPTTKLAMATMDSSNNEKPNSIYVMNYRKKGMFPSLIVYQGPLSIGATRESVEG